MIRAFACLACFLLVGSAPGPAPTLDRVVGHDGVTFGMTPKAALVALGGDGFYGELCSHHDAVAFQSHQGGQDFGAMAYVEQDRVTKIELMLESARVQSDRAACLRGFETALATQRQRYHGYELQIRDEAVGWTETRSATLRFADASSVEVRSKYWRSGGTCYTYVTYRPGGETTVSTALAMDG